MIEIQLLILNIIIIMALIMITALLLMKAIIYHNEVKLNQLDTQKRAIQLSHDEAKMKLEKSTTDFENTKLLMEYAQFMKSNAQDLPSGYQSKVNETFKEIEKEK